MPIGYTSSALTCDLAFRSLSWIICKNLVSSVADGGGVTREPREPHRGLDPKQPPTAADSLSRITSLSSKVTSCSSERILASLVSSRAVTDAPAVGPFNPQARLSWLLRRRSSRVSWSHTHTRHYYNHPHAHHTHLPAHLPA